LVGLRSWGSQDRAGACNVGAVTLLSDSKKETNLTYTCPSEVTSLFDYIVKCTPIIISLVVAAVGFRQWRLSEEKLRSDMYARRFSVYENTLHLYYAIMWDTDKTSREQLISAQVKFMTSVRESGFLFNKDDGISDTLNAFRLESNPFVNQKMGMPGQEPGIVVSLEKRILELEAKLWPYIDMTKLGVPTPSCFPR
jgi:hypothetical protein